MAAVALAAPVVNPLVAQVTGFDRVARTLEARARTLAEAAAQLRHEATPAQQAWRDPGLLWPLFTKG